jgi:SAM-dependent methyltransferase
MGINTIEVYNQRAIEYDNETSKFWAEFPEAVFIRFKESLPGKRVLSIGSGPGRDAERLRALGLDVICLDPSPSMVEITRKKGFLTLQQDIRDAQLDYLGID